MIDVKVAPPSARVRVNVALPGAYAWLTTVLLPAAESGAPLGARVGAGLALVALVGGVFLAPGHPRVGRAVGVGGFVAAALFTWLLLGARLDIGRLDPVRAALGGVGWALFALGWGAVRRVDAVPEDDPHVLVGAPLELRERVPTLHRVILVLSLCGALAPNLLAWTVARREHAVLAHAAALLVGLAVLSAGAILASATGRRRVLPTPRARLSAASGAMTAVAALTLLGAVLSMR